MTSKGQFEIGITDQHLYWAESNDGLVTIHRRPKDGTAGDEVLARWSPETLRNLLLWAEDEKSVTFSLTGPLAHQVRKLSGELSLTPEMFVWHAVKIFIETSPEA
ncbi:MAG: hypothetical protein O7E55_08295 [Chloroflexi bacterium]|nr:hypothetical protein [Chloroflexota bacterium]